MNLRSALLGTTAILGATALMVPSSASAFDVNINGFLNFNAVGGDVEESINDGDSRKNFDFTTDTEIHVQAANTDDETGIRYGMTVEFEADPQTSDDNGIDEAWLFIDGAFGGFRAGNEDGVYDNSKLGAQSIAAGTGGIDGQQVVASTPFAGTNSGDATKVRYYSPSVGGFTVGVSYTPLGGVEGNQIATEPVDGLEDWVEGGVIYDGSFGGLDLRASAVAGWADGNDATDDFFGYNLGAVIGFSGISVAGSFWEDEDGPNEDRTGMTAGAAATLGPADVSLTYAQILDADGPNGEATNIVASATVGMMPGLSLKGDVSFFDRDEGGDDDGIVGVGRIAVAF